jgi:hypothetical protein
MTTPLSQFQEFRRSLDAHFTQEEWDASSYTIRLVCFYQISHSSSVQWALGKALVIQNMDEGQLKWVFHYMAPLSYDSLVEVLDTAERYAANWSFA